MEKIDMGNGRELIHNNMTLSKTVCGMRPRLAVWSSEADESDDQATVKLVIEHEWQAKYIAAHNQHGMSATLTPTEARALAALLLAAAETQERRNLKSTPAPAPALEPMV